MNLHLLLVFSILRLCFSQFIVKPVMINTSILIPRIVKGRAVQLGEVPYQISLRKLTSRTYHHYTTFCGGTLITKSKILTAAHCFAPKRTLLDIDCGSQVRMFSKSDLRAIAVAGNIQTVAVHPNPPKTGKKPYKVKIPKKIPWRTNITSSDRRKELKLTIPKTRLSTNCTSPNLAIVSHLTTSNECKSQNGEMVNDKKSLNFSSYQQTSIDWKSSSSAKAMAIGSNQTRSTVCASSNDEKGLVIGGNQPTPNDYESQNGERELAIVSNNSTSTGHSSPSDEKHFSIASNKRRSKRNNDNTTVKPDLQTPKPEIQTPIPVVDYGQWKSLKAGYYPRDYKFPTADICVLITVTRFTITPTVATIPYATLDIDYPANMTCVASGFGKISQDKDAPASSVLMIAEFETIPRYYCNLLHRKNMEKFICTSAKISDAAKGDSGGPLVCKNTGDHRETETGLLVGIISGHRKDIGSFFTRVSSYYDFIEEARATRNHNSVILVFVIYGALWIC